MLTKEREQEVISLCQNLIKAKSYSGGESLVVDELIKYFEANKFDEIVVDEYGNIIGKIKGNRAGKTILFDGHIDTVPVTDPRAWNFDPFGAIISDGKIYGGKDVN